MTCAPQLVGQPTRRLPRKARVIRDTECRTIPANRCADARGVPDDARRRGLEFKGSAMSHLLEQVLTVPAPLAYILIVTLVFAEAALFVGFVVPGETAVVIGGVLAASGRVSLPLLLALVVVAGVVGDSVGFEVDRRFGPRLLESRFLRGHRSRLESAQRLLRERGSWAVLLGRFTAFLRAMTPALAGASRMPYPRFLTFNVTGGLIWGVGVTLLGYFAGSSYATVEQLLGRTSAILVAFLVLAGVFLWRRRRNTSEPCGDANVSRRH